jgi:Xaa-Pro dipeptidase
VVKAGFGPGYKVPGLPHRTGHGIGMDVHEAPYFVGSNRAPLAVGNTGSIEPTIAIYGEFGIRLEEHIVVTETGAALADPAGAVCGRSLRARLTQHVAGRSGRWLPRKGMPPLRDR